MQFSMFMCKSLIVLGLFSACADKTRLQAQGPAVEKKGVAADVKNGSSGTAGSSETPVEQPLWTVANTPMKLRCEPAPTLGFKISEGFSNVNKYMLSRFAMIGQESFKFDDSFLQNFFKQAGFSAVKTFENKAKGVQGFVATSEKINLVVFRGTHSSGGFMTDLNFLLAGDSFVNMPGGLHGGFKSAYDSVQQVISTALDPTRRPQIPTYYVGHSLGGALAMLAASDGLGRGVKVEGLVTLGQPRAGNATYAANFSSALNEKYFRYVHNNDLVPHLPPSMSAAAVAAPMISQNDFLKLGIQAAGLLKFTHVGVPQMLGSSAVAMKAGENDDKWDVAYWTTHGDSVRQSVTNILNGSTAVTLQSLAQNNLIADHDLDKYLCEMFKLIK